MNHGSRLVVIDDEGPESFHQDVGRQVNSVGLAAESTAAKGSCFSALFCFKMARSWASEVMRLVTKRSLPAHQFRQRRLGS